MMSHWLGSGRLVAALVRTVAGAWPGAILGERIEIRVVNRILSAGEAIRPSVYLLSSKNQYDSLVLQVAYKVSGNLQSVNRRFTVGIAEEETVDAGLEESAQPASPLQFRGLPVTLDSITYINWYGNTEFAYEKRYSIYKDLQGLHSGIDFMAPYGTPVTSVVSRTGTVVSINNAPHDYRAGPGNVQVDYGADVLVLYGHSQYDRLPDKVKRGQKIDPGDTIAYVGSDTSGLVHLHLEVIRRKPPGGIGRPGDIRTNPVPFFGPTALDHLRQKAAGIGAKFHKLSGETKWQTPELQPDIIPGKEILVP